mgnify:CR=1 FL=1
MKGHWVVYELLRQQVEKGEQYIWFHAASLGEFEQGRPLIEMIRENIRIIRYCFTFFSPFRFMKVQQALTGGSGILFLI